MIREVVLQIILLAILLFLAIKEQIFFLIGDIMNFNKLNFCLFSNQNWGGGKIIASLKESNDNV